MYDKLISAPVEDPLFLDWIKTLPCAVPQCRSRFVDPHHTGPKGLSQTASDRSAIPLCRAHHNVWHHKGRVWFEAEYGLDINRLVKWLNEKPQIRIYGYPGAAFSAPRYWMVYREEEFALNLVSEGVSLAVRLALETARSLPVWEAA